MDIQLRTATVKQQSFWAVLGLSIITLGIYMIFWYHRINSEMKNIGEAYGDNELAASNPTNSVLAMIFGVFTLGIATLISIHGTAKRIRRTQAALGQTVDYSVGVHWLLVLFSGLWVIYAQMKLNELYLRAQAMGGAHAVPMTPQAAAV